MPYLCYTDEEIKEWKERLKRIEERIKELKLAETRPQSAYLLEGLRDELKRMIEEVEKRSE
jgi:uncharacterized protein YecE (DUF72 family)